MIKPLKLIPASGVLDSREQLDLVHYMPGFTPYSVKLSFGQSFAKGS